MEPFTQKAPLGHGIEQYRPKNPGAQSTPVSDMFEVSLFASEKLNEGVMLDDVRLKLLSRILMVALE